MVETRNVNLSLGLAKDVEPVNIPDGFYSFALNALHDSVDGSQGTISTEHSNQLCKTLSDDIISTIPIDGEKFVTFSGNGIISIFDSTNCTVEEYVNLDLGFDKNYPITGQFIIRKGCERTVYFRDGLNPDRFYNFEKPSEFIEANDFNLNPDINQVCITPSISEGGGRTEYGSYSFVLELLDTNLNVVHRTIPSNPTYIVTDANKPFVGLSNKSIRLDISNLDTTFSFVKLGVIYYTSQDGITQSAHYIGELIPINGSSLVYYYRGFNTSNGDSEIDVDQLLTSKVVYETSKVMEQVQGRLVRANLTEQSIDYSNFQKTTSKIRTYYIVDAVASSVTRLTEQGDEILAKGIVYVFKNGQLSPAFHIPGRSKLVSDTEIVTDVNGNSVQKWKSLNTSARLSGVVSGHDSHGYYGYYQCESVYTNPVNFCGEDYWGKDADGNTLVDSPIRHHRVPDRNQEPLVEFDSSFNVSCRYIGSYYENIEYPHPDIVGHYFVSNVRDASNSTVLSSGIMIPYNYESDSTGDKIEGRYIHYLPNPQDNERQSNTVTQNYISLPFLVDKDIPQGQYVKVNGYFSTIFDQNRPKYNNFFDNDLPYRDYQLYGKHTTVSGYTSRFEEKLLEDSLYLPRLSTTLEYPNRSASSDFNILVLNEVLNTYATNRANLNYTYIKQDISVHCNLFNIQYKFDNTCALTSTENAVFGGDTFISPLSLTNISDITIGDKIRWGTLAIPFVGIPLFVASLFQDEQVNIEYELIQNLWMESPHNFRNRTQGIDLCDQYYVENINSLIIAKTTIEYDTNKVKLRDSICSEYYGYDKDYSVVGVSRFARSLSVVYNYCSECLNEYPNRIIWSEVQSDESVSDSYRVFKPLNYLDISANRGSITALNYKNNKVFVRTKQSLFQLQPNPQRLQTDGLDIYIGTGDFFSIPPYEIQSTDIGYGGQTSVLGQVNCLHGLVWIDESQGKIFSLSDNLEEISKYKMYHWFEQNLNSNIIEFLKSKGLTYNNDRYGTRLTYDPKFERLLVHKIDYKPTEFMLQQYSKLTYINQEFYRNGVKIDYSNPLYFENKSWTISYSFRSKTWISWHSYQPDYMFYSGKTFYSIKENEIWSHDNYYNFFTYFDTVFEYIIEFPDKGAETTNLHAVHYYSQAQEFKEGQWIDVNEVTFNHALAYNRFQSTGKFELKLDDLLTSLIWSNTIKPVESDDKEYKIAQIRDLAINTPVSTSNWNQINTSYIDGQGYIDIVPNTSNLDFNRPQHELRELQDKWCLVRLYFNKPKYRLVTYIINTQAFNVV